MQMEEIVNFSKYKRVETFYREVEDNQLLNWQVNIANFSEGAYVIKILDKEGNAYEKKVMVVNKK